MTDKITVEVDGEARELLMTFGILNAVAKTVGSIDNLGAITLDDNIREMTIRLCLLTKEKGKPPVIPDFADLDISPADANAILIWATDHVIDFFLQSLEATKVVTDKYQGRLDALMRSSTGTAA